jgi:hypothetical protein
MNQVHQLYIENVFKRTKRLYVDNEDFYIEINLFVKQKIISIQRKSKNVKDMFDEATCLIVKDDNIRFLTVERID